MGGSAGRLIWLLGPLAVLLAACGDVGGGGQCGGVESSGICVSLDSITPKDEISAKDTTNVDAFRFVDCDSTTAGNQTERIADHTAKIKLTTTVLSGVAAGLQPKFLTVTGINIDYSISPTSSGPALTSTSDNSTFTVPVPGSVDRTITFVSLATKQEYENRGGSATAIPSYTASITVSGVDEFNRAFSARGFSTFTIGNFDNCTGGLK